MYLHENKNEFRNIIQIISDRENIDTDIIEKDYYVCLVLKELAKKQDYLKIRDFGYFTCKYTDEMLRAFNLMQDKYIFKEEYRKTIDETREILTKIRKITEKIEK